MRSRYATLVVIGLAGCAQGADPSGDLAGMQGGGAEGGLGDTSLPPDGSVADGNDGASSSPTDGGKEGSSGDAAGGDAGDGSTGPDSPPDSSLPDTGTPDVGAPDTGPDTTAQKACGICDQVWVCNGFADPWVSNGPEECDDTGNSTKLFCVNGDTINYADPNNNDGTWAVTSSGFSMYFNSLNGTVEIDCVP